MRKSGGDLKQMRELFSAIRVNPQHNGGVLCQMQRRLRVYSREASQSEQNGRVHSLWNKNKYKLFDENQVPRWHVSGGIDPRTNTGHHMVFDCSA